MPEIARRAILLAIVALALIAAAPARADPTSPLCDDGSWQRAHPLICDTGGPLPSLGGGTGGGGPDVGLIGRILGTIHDLTGLL